MKKILFIMTFGFIALLSANSGKFFPNKTPGTFDQAGGIVESKVLFIYDKRGSKTDSDIQQSC